MTATHPAGEQVLCESPTPTHAVSSAARRNWKIYTPGELRQRCKELNSSASLIAGLIPQRSLSIVVGDSGLGKSPLLYQAAICIAEGISFLGHPVTQGRVLYLDFENGLGDVDELITRLSRHLGLTAKPQDLLLWNYNDAPPEWKAEHLASMVREAQPTWIVIDSLSAYAPDIEEKSSRVTRVYQEFRKIIRECGTTISAVHHIRKPSSKRDEAPPALEEDPHGWFLQARGPRALINSADVRIGVDRFGKGSVLDSVDGQSREVALVIGGFSRVRGNIATTFIARVLDEDEEAQGYRKLSGVSLLFNPDQEQTYAKFPATFRFKDAQRVYGKGAQATTDFLKKCLSVGVLRKDGREYRKVEVAERAE